MDEEIERAPFLRQRGKQRVDRDDVLDIAREHDLGAQRARERKHALPERLALVGKSQHCAVRRERAGDTPGDRVVVGDPHDQPALALHQRIHATQLSLRDSRQASSRLNTTDALVPPNPNELDSTQPSSTSSRRSRTMGTSANAGSSVSMLALSQIKPLFIIRIEYTASCTPAAPSEWPVRKSTRLNSSHVSESRMPSSA